MIIQSERRIINEDAKVLIVVLLFSMIISSGSSLVLADEIFNGFAYDEDGLSEGSVVISVESTNDITAEVDNLKGVIKIENQEWQLKSYQKEVINNVAFFKCYFKDETSLGDNTFEGEIAIPLGKSIISGYINCGAERMIAFTAGTGHIGENTLREIISMDQDKSPDKEEYVIKSVDNYLRKEYLSNTYQVVHVVGVPSLSRYESARYHIRSMLKTNYGENPDVIAVRGQYNYIDPANIDGTKGLTCIGVAPNVNTAQTISYGVPYAAFSVLLNFFITRSSQVNGMGESYVNNYSSHLPASRHYYTGSSAWSTDGKSVGGYFDLRMTNDSVSNYSYTVNAKSRWVLYDLYNYVYTYRTTPSIPCIW